MIIYFILIFLICSLCLSLKKGYRPHPLYIYQMITEMGEPEMDSFAQDPKNHVHVQPNQELLIPEIKIEHENIVQIDD